MGRIAEWTREENPRNYSTLGNYFDDDFGFEHVSSRIDRRGRKYREERKAQYELSQGEN